MNILNIHFEVFLKRLLMIHQISYQFFYQILSNWLLNFTLFMILEVKSISIETNDMALKTLLKGYMIDS
jgi:hypothetical protein